MGYCTVNDFRATLAQTLSSGSPNPATLTTPAKLADLGKMLNLTSSSGSSVGTYSLIDVNYYIRQASSIVDAAVRQQYVAPLRPIASMTMRLLSDINEYTSSFGVTRIDNVVVGDILVLVGGGIEERVEVESVDIEDGITTVMPFYNDFAFGTTRVLLVKFPDPIPYITAKLACAQFYDRYAKAQSEPMKSDYSEILRKEANAELNNIREGRTILDGIERVGSRFVNANLYGRYGLGGFIDQDGTRSDQSRG